MKGPLYGARIDHMRGQLGKKEVLLCGKEALLSFGSPKVRDENARSVQQL
jgi:hypothetical protein